MHNSFNEEFKDYESMRLDIDDDDFELEMEKSLHSKSINERQKDFNNWYNALKRRQDHP